MKKSLLMAAAAMIAAGASASDFRTVSVGDGTISSLKSGSRELVSVDGSTRAGENSMKYSVAVDPANPYNILSMNGLTKGERVYQCFEFTLDNLKLFKGAKITSINVTTGGTQNGRNTVERANLFMSHDITAAPFYKKTVTFAETALKENEFALETPYEISDDQPLYIGYYFLCNGKNEGYIPVDGYPSAEPGGLIATSAGSKWPGKKDWQNITSGYGSCCISVTVEGDNLPQNYVSILASEFPKSVTTGGKLTYKILIRNKGANDVSSLGVLTEFGSVKDEGEFNGNTMASGGVATVPVEVVCPEEGVFDVIATLSKVNGNENNSSSNTAKANVAVFSKGFDRNLLLEEATGAWCGYCPAGMVMMENIKKTYPADRCIPIAVHQGDRLEVDGYMGFIYDYISRFPMAIVNRDVQIMPTANNVLSQFKSIYDEVTGNPAYGKISVEASVDEATRMVKIDSKVTLSMSTDSPIGVSFVVVEDNLGPYSQQNYFAGGQLGFMGDWSNKPSVVETYYEDVAVAIKDYPSIPDALPKEIIKDTEYTVTGEIPVDNPGRPGLSIYNEYSDTFRVVAILTNLSNGEVINAAQVTVNNPISGVEKVEKENTEIRVENGSVVAGDEEVEVYTLDGRRTRNSALASGLYIVKAGNRTVKVLVK